jgi:hypothetical protein
MFICILIATIASVFDDYKIAGALIKWSDTAFLDFILVFCGLAAVILILHIVNTFF